jgi:aminopeptidase
MTDPLQTIENRYARLLSRYCLDLQPGERIYIRSTTLAEPLVREVYREALRAGAHPEVQLDFDSQGKILLEEGKDEQLQFAPTLYSRAMSEFEAFLFIMAPSNLRGESEVKADRRKIRQEAMHPYRKRYFERTGKGEMKRSLCLYPTPALAQEAAMSLEDYRQFVYRACRLDQEDPGEAWLNVRAEQQKYVDYLNRSRHIQFKGPGIDISFSCEGRTWINSDGRTNMPSGEVFTSPIEDSVQGVVHFSYPAIYMGREVEGVTLWVEQGKIQKWEAKHGQDFLDEIFKIPGTRRFGEAAVGTNYQIDRFSKNILFDEKIGGTIHMAIGQSYPQTGGKNESSVHWDMIADMRDGGEIYADSDRIYTGGKFML